MAIHGFPEQDQLNISRDEMDKLHNLRYIAKVVLENITKIITIRDACLIFCSLASGRNRNRKYVDTFIGSTQPRISQVTYSALR